MNYRQLAGLSAGEFILMPPWLAMSLGYHCVDQRPIAKTKKEYKYESMNDLKKEINLDFFLIAIN